MGNERKTEALTRNLLEVNGYYGDNFIVEEQSSDNAIIDNLLKNASKSGNGKGKPEFIITSKDNKDLLIVIECKASVSNHKSEGLDKAKDYACDGAIHYASYLSKEFNVIAIGVSGETEEELKIDTYYRGKGSKEYTDMGLFKILSLEGYKKHLYLNSTQNKLDISALLTFARKLHNDMRDYAKLSENEKPLLVSAILLGLRNTAFRKNYMDYDFEEGVFTIPDTELSDKLLLAIDDELRKLESEGISLTKRENLNTTWSFIRARDEFKSEAKIEINLDEGKTKKTLKVNPLRYLIRGIHSEVYPYLDSKMDSDKDIIGLFYSEFLKYTGGDGKGLGIVLTPDHITSLMAELADLSHNTRVLDTCTGTAGILIACMNAMFKSVQEDKNVKTEKEAKELIEKIRKENLIGIEQQPHMYALACSNMILRGDGKSNLELGSCFDYEDKIKKLKPNRGIINPPYAQKVKGLSELDFIKYMLDCLEQEGLGFAIVPMSCAIDTKKSTVKLKEEILSNHTLLAVMSMPEDLFYPVGVVTCIMVFKAHVPHNSELESWFGYWKDDGFVKTKKDGRVDLNGKWSNIKTEWVKMFKNRKEIVGKSVKKCVTAKDEWCAEAYMETDYSVLTSEMFEEEMKKYLAFKILNTN